MLPHFLWADLKDVIADLNDAGFPFQLDWYRPFLEFRFPRCGTLQLENIRIELRTAIEPWHVLGEESTRLGTARYVDSSVERLQVKVDGLTDGRYVLACNGRRVPLTNTGTHGEYVAGVRYRAWQPPSALHPTIGVHSPLVFDIIDTWDGRSIGGRTSPAPHHPLQGRGPPRRQLHAAAVDRAARALLPRRHAAGADDAAGGRSAGRISAHARFAAYGRLKPQVWRRINRQCQPVA